MRPKHDTSWQKVSPWYQDSVGLKGNYYQQEVIFPQLLPALKLTPKDKVLDLGCGQGVLERQISPEVAYLGLDASKSLIEFARNHSRGSKHQFEVTDLTRPWPTADQDFTIVVMLLSLQNMENFDAVISAAARHLVKDGQLVAVLNHPCFRIPRQSSWQIDQKNKLEYRRINRYLTPLKVPIVAHPGKRDRAITWSFHHPLSDYFRSLAKAGFVVTNLEEWTSPKTSSGRAAKMENRARQEFPLFLTIFAKKY